MNEAAAASDIAKAYAAQAQREKHWEECDPGEKIERLRDEVARLLHLNTALSELAEHLMQHQHGSDGALLTPMRHPLANRAQSAMIGSGTFSGRIGSRIANKWERGS